MRSSFAWGRAATLLIAWAVLGCGGGGGGGGGAPKPTTGVITGTILLPDEDFGMLAEREPNDSVGQAQALPPLEPRASLTVAGEADITAAHYGGIDSVDAYRVFCHVAQFVTLTLTASTDGLGLGNFDIAAFDTGTGNPLASSATLSNPEVASFLLVGDQPADLVVTCAAGFGAYTLRIDTSDPPMPLVGRAPATIVAPLSPLGPLSYEAAGYALQVPVCAEGRLLVRLRGRHEDGGGAEGARRAATLARGVALRTTSGGSHIVAFKPAYYDTGGREALALAAKISREPDVAWAEPDWIVEPQALPNDPDLARQWHLFAVGTPSAWDITFGSSSVTVGIVDTGITSHPDLDAQMVPGYDFVSDSTAAGDGDGRDTDPTDTGARDEFDHRSSWHGTHIAGIIGARGNDGYGLCGVAPGCKMMMLRALGRGGGVVSDIADAIRYGAGLTATAHGPALAAPLPILNLSFGTSLYSAELDTACAAASAAGVLLISSTGNSGGSVLYPAKLSSVMAVGAVDSRLVKPDYSNSGAEVALVAPGGGVPREIDGDGFQDGILSTVVDESRGTPQPGEGYLTGTSMATAVVAGAAALLKSVDPTLTPAQIRADLLSTAQDLGALGVDTDTGAGLLRVSEAVKKALADKGTPRTDPPRLLLSTTSLRFNSSQSLLQVNVLNAGSGLLHIAAIPAVSTDSGVPWLSAATIESPIGSTSDKGQVVVTVSRAGLGVGVYSGTVRLLDSSSTVGSIRVVMEVGSGFQIEGATFQIVARETTGGGVRSSGFAFPWEGNRYVLVDIPPGDYTLLAGTDLDNDGFFCETGDWCGTSAGTIHVHAGDLLTGQDVILTK